MCNMKLNFLLALLLPSVQSSVDIIFEHLGTSHAVNSKFQGVYMKPYSPSGLIVCTSTDCEGDFEADLSSDSSLKFEWRADEAKTKGVSIDLESASASLDFGK